jgi:hypothetical protein
LRLQSLKNRLIIFECPIFAGSPLDGAVLSADRLIVVETVEQDATNVLSKVVGVALDV